MNTKTLFDFQCLSILRDMNAAVEALAVLKTLGIGLEAYNYTARARDYFLGEVLRDVRVETLDPALLNPATQEPLDELSY